MRIFNNTEFELEFLLSLYRHLFADITADKIESITFNKDSADVFGIDELLATRDYAKDIEVTGTIRWFDRSAGMIRLSNGQSLPFYACNVEGANSMHEHLVTNVEFNQGDKVRATIPACESTFKHCGLVNVRKA